MAPLRTSGSKGFTLVELMVSLALGLLVSLGAMQLFVTNQQTFNYQKGMADVQSSGRFVLDYLRSDIWRAGASTVDVTPVPFPSATAQSPSGYIMSDGSSSGLNSNDQLVMRFYASTAGTDCEGNSYAAGVFVNSRYFVRTDSDTGMPGLACDASTDSGTSATASGVDTGLILVAGVDSFQVLYGVDDGVNAAATLNRYLTATQYIALATKPAILSVQVGLLLRSAESAGVNETVNQDFYVLDNRIQYGDLPADNRVRRLFVGTMAVRNYRPAGV